MDWLPFVALARSVAIVARAIGLVIVSSVVVEPLISLAVKPSALINCSFLIYRLNLERKRPDLVLVEDQRAKRVLMKNGGLVRLLTFIECPLIQ